MWQSPSGEHKRLRGEDAKNARRAQVHLARDINDQRTLATIPTGIKRHGKLNWLLLAVILVLLSVAATGIFTRDIQLDVKADCTTAAVTFNQSSFAPRADMVFRATGPAGDSYRIVIVDAAGVQTRMSPDFPMKSCLSETFVFGAPDAGTYAVKLLKISGQSRTELSSAELLIF